MQESSAVRLDAYNLTLLASAKVPRIINSVVYPDGAAVHM